MKRTKLGFLEAGLLTAGILLLAGTAVLPAQMHDGSPSTGGQNDNGMNSNMPPGGMQTPGGFPNGQQSQMEQDAYGNIRRNLQVETDLSKLALKHSSDDDVKKFAQQVISDNRAVGQQVGPPHAEDGMMFAPQVPSQTQKAEKQMKKLSGLPFDQMYLVQMDAYVKDDQQVAAKVSAMTGSPDMNDIGMRERTLADERAQDISQLAGKENFKIQ